MTSINLGPVSIATEQYAIQGNAILGIKESGKSYTATMFAERLMDAGVPIVALDPIGIWRFLRVAGKGKGYPVVVAGGEHGDLPLTPQGAPEIVRAAMRDGISIVLDLYSMKLSKADWRAIVEAAVRTLLYENKQHGLRHVFIEEAAEFAPQRVGPEYGRVYAEVEKLARMGGNVSLGYTLISPRAEEVNKAVLELCDALFLFRQKGKNSLISLGKWLDAAGATDGKQIAGTLAMMGQGECWAWPAGTETPVRVKRIPEKRTFHPDRRAMRSAVVVERKVVDVSAFVEHMSGTLAKVIEEAEANDPARLKRRIVELEHAVKTQHPSPGMDEATVRRMLADSESNGRILGATDIVRRVGPMIDDLAEQMRAISVEATGQKLTISIPLPKGAGGVNVYRGDPPRKIAEARIHTDGALKPSLQRVVDAIGWWSKIGKSPVERDRACVVAGLSPKASTFGVYVAEFARMGLIISADGKVALTPAGFGHAVIPAAATREDLYQCAAGLLAPQERRIFDIVYAVHPKEIRRDAVAERAGLSPTASTAGVYLARVAVYGIVEPGSRGCVRAADWLFP